MKPWRLLAGLAFGVLAPLAAQAHAYLVRSEPPANASLTQTPPEVRLRFSEPVEPAFVTVKVLLDDKALASQPAASVDADGKTVRLHLPAGGGPGAYAVAWDIVAKDGHRTQGRIAFRVKAR